jgi:ribosomal-protein-alanine N-acetyltransferase
MCARVVEDNKARVSLCRVEDLAGVQEVLKVSPEAAAWPAAATAEMFERYPVYFLVSFQGDEMTGFVSGRRVANEAEILNLAVSPKARRQGVGRSLVQALLEVFAHEGATQIFLEVRESNASAITFYQGLGFRQVGRRVGYYREPDEAALVLTLALNASSAGTR